MAKRFSKGWRPQDVNQLAHHLVRPSTETQPEPARLSAQPSRADISRVMAAMGRRGGKIGGKRRMETMTSQQRREIAARAARKRWDKAKGAA